MKNYSFLKKHYNIGKINTVSEVKGGVLTVNNLIKTSKGLYFLKKYRKQKMDRINIAEFTEKFFAKKFPMILPVETTKGTLHIIHGEDLYVLYPYIQKKEIKKKLDNSSAFSLGKLLGEMHNYAEEHKNEYSHLNLQVEFKNLDKKENMEKISKLLDIVRNLPKKSKIDTMYQKSLEFKLDYVSKDRKKHTFLPKDNFLLHGDFHARNVFWKGSAITHIFDTEKAFLGSVSFDMVRCMMYSCIEYTFTKEKFDIARSFLEGYNGVRKINKKELERNLDIFITKDYYTVWMENTKYMLDNGKVDKIYQDTMKGLKYFIKHRETFIQKILKMV